MHRYTSNPIHLLIVVAFLTGCSSSDFDQKTADSKVVIDNKLQAAIEENSQIKEEIEKKKKTAATYDIPHAVQQALSTDQFKEKKEKPVMSFSVHDTSARILFNKIAKSFNTNIIVSPDVNDRVSLSLEKATIDDVFESLHSLYHFNIKSIGHGYIVKPRKLETKVIVVDRMNLKRSGSSTITINSNTSDSEGSSDSGSTNNLGGGSSSISTTYSTGDVWVNMTETLKSLIHFNEIDDSSDDETKKVKQKKAITVDPSMGTVVVTAYPEEIEEIEKYIHTLESLSNKQVIIEAKILQVDYEASSERGLNLVLPIGHAGKRQITLNTSDANQPVLSYEENDTVSSTFSTAIDFLEKQGHVVVKASPTASTMSGIKAFLKVGQDKVFSQSNTSSSTTASGSSTNKSFSSTKLFSGIAFDATPYVRSDHCVILHLHPYISRITSERVFVDSSEDGKANYVNTPLTNITETDTVVRLCNGEIGVIGGLMSSEVEDFSTSVPGISDLKTGLGAKKRKSEVVVLVRAKILDNQRWNSQINRMKEHL